MVIWSPYQLNNIELNFFYFYIIIVLNNLVLGGNIMRESNRSIILIAIGIIIFIGCVELLNYILKGV